VSLLPFGLTGGYLVPNPFFGQILQARAPRQIQFGLKFVF
jgi:hypothetical protein